MIRGVIREGVTSGLEAFSDFLPLQFFTLLVMIVLYIYAMPYLGFYVSSILFMTASLLFLRVKLWQIVMAEIAIFVLIYCAFTLLLEVRLPKGELLEEWLLCSSVRFTPSTFSQWPQE